jgi:PST family polysaccharide transporter
VSEAPIKEATKLHILARNILSLFVLQVSAYLIPLITTPYLARTLDIEHFGLLGIALAVAGYVSLLSNWGFGYTATREVARHSADPVAIRAIYWNTLLAKAMLCACALVVFITVICCVPEWRRMLPLLLTFSLVPIAGVFNTGWLLQGLEQIVSFARISLLSRILAVPLVFALVRHPDDVIAVAAIGGGTELLSAAISIVVADRAVRLLPGHFDLRATYKQITTGASVFLATGGIHLYTQSNIVLVGVIAGPIQAGLYSGAEKLQRALTSLIGPASTAVYPRINNLLVSAPAKSHRLMLITLTAQGLATLGVSIAMFLTAHMATLLLLGEQYEGAVPVIRLLSALPFLIGLNNALGVNMMFPFGLNAEVTRITIAGGILNVGLLSFLTYVQGAIGAAIAVVVTETFVTVGFAWVVYTRRKMVFQIHGS